MNKLVTPNTQGAHGDSARLLSEIIARSAQAMAVLASGKELTSIELMHLKGSAEQLEHVIATLSTSPRV